jgi:hypothetical protein
LPHPEEWRSHVSKDGRQACRFRVLADKDACAGGSSAAIGDGITAGDEAFESDANQPGIFTFALRKYDD